MPNNLNFLAFDTSTDRLSVAVSDGVRVWQHAGPGGALASTQLIPVITGLLAEAGLALGDLRAVVFGRGPGSFTGLRTACSVAQGLAFGAGGGAGIDVLPVNTLMAVAEEARWHIAATAGGMPAGDVTLTAMLDARMDEVYMQRYAYSAGLWTAHTECALIRPEDFNPARQLDPAEWLCGNVFEAYAGRLAGAAGLRSLTAYPSAAALLRLAPALVLAGNCVDAALALPLYVRDKVALTTDERAAAKAQKTPPQA